MHCNSVLYCPNCPNWQFSTSVLCPNWTSTLIQYLHFLNSDTRKKFSTFFWIQYLKKMGVKKYWITIRTIQYLSETYSVQYWIQFSEIQYSQRYWGQSSTCTELDELQFSTFLVSELSEFLWWKNFDLIYLLFTRKIIFADSNFWFRY